MNVAGFEEALVSSVVIEIETGLTARVASVAGLTLLKLAAWVDRGLESNAWKATRMPPTCTDC
jgi:predicted nucleotidyltransferase